MKYATFHMAWLFVLGSTAAKGQVIYNNASTAGESYARGVSGIIQAQGQRNLSNSQAAINLEDAYSAAIDNSVKSVNAYWEKKDIYAQRQQQKNYETAQRRQGYLSRHGLQSLTSKEFDRTTGQVTWPKVLTQPQYSEFQTTLDELFKKRAQEGALTGDDYMEAANASREWRAMLAKQRDTYPKNVLSQMTRFILKLDRELNENLS
jgi:hypothetical protein